LKKDEEKKKLADVKATESAADAAKRKKAQEEVALRLEKLQKQMNQPAAPVAKVASVPPQAPVVAPGPMSKERRLADLLRRYEADEITPLQYHTERAKIVAEP
jgi:hypothetical protein